MPAVYNRKKLLPGDQGHSEKAEVTMQVPPHTRQNRVEVYMQKAEVMMQVPPHKGLNRVEVYMWPLLVLWVSIVPTSTQPHTQLLTT